MVKDLKVDDNYYFLLNWLFVLDNYKFDSDIIKLINELFTLVNKKIFNGMDFENLNICNQENYYQILFRKIVFYH